MLPTLDLRAVVADIVRYAPSQLVPAVAGFLLIVALTHALSVTMYGQYILVVTTIAVVRIAANGWLHDAILRFYPAAEETGDQARASRIIAGSFGASVAVAIIALAVLGLVSAARLPFGLLTVTAGSIAFLLVGEALLDCGQAILRAQRAAWSYSASTSAAAATRLAGSAVGAIGASNALTGVLLGRCLGTLVVALPTIVGAVWIQRRRSASGESAAESSLSVRAFLAYGLPVSGTVLLGFALSDADRFLLQALSNTAQVGIYSASYLIASGSLTVVFPLVMSAAFPLLVRLWDRPEGPAAVQRMMPSVLRYFLILATPATAGVILLARPLLATLTTSAYANHAAVIGPIALGIFCLGLAQYVTIGLSLARRTAVLLAVLAAAAASNLILNMILIPVAGILGAALATLIGYALYVVVGGALAERYVQVSPPLASVARIAAGCLAMAIVLLPAQWNLPANLATLALLAALGAAIYAAVIVALGEIPLALVTGLRAAAAKERP